jgi:hypothetical protein
MPKLMKMMSSTPRLAALRIFHSTLALLGLVSAAIAEVPTGNLLVNGSGAAPLSTGWTLLANGGSGWYQSASGGYDSTPGYFITSYGWCRRSQVIDLLAAGLTAEELDGPQPPVIKISEAIHSYRQGNPDQYYIRVELRGAADEFKASWNAGTQAAPKTHDGSGWIVESTEFRFYPVGVRKIYFEDGGVDSGYWDGPYGTYHDAASVTLVAIPDSDGDGLPNDWEQTYGTNPEVFDSNDDPDLDGLTNWDEYLLGTLPRNPDTDSDGYLDGVETMTGIWNGIEDTGTQPSRPDTDGDGLPDGAENPDLPFVGANQAGTSPPPSG